MVDLSRVDMTRDEFQEIEKLTEGLIGADGKEINSPKVIFVDATPSPKTLEEQISRVLRHQLSAIAARQEFETFSESEDFEIPEAEEPLSGYEVREMIDEEPIQRVSEKPGDFNKEKEVESETTIPAVERERSEAERERNGSPLPRERYIKLNSGEFVTEKEYEEYLRKT